MAITPIRGRDFMLEIEKDGVPVPVCYSTDFTLQMAREMIEKTPLVGLDRDYLASFKGYTIGISTVVSYADGFSFLDIKKAYENGTRLVWYGSNSENGGVVHSGVVLINSLSWASPVRGEFVSEAAAIGCGPVITELLPTSVDVYLANASKVRLPGCPNPYPVSVFWYTETGGMGVFIGLANNADDVVSIFNDYSMTSGGGYYTLQLGTSGCDFVMLSAWNAPFIPTVVYAAASPDFALSSDQENNMVVSPDQDNDQALSPAYS